MPATCEECPHRKRSEGGTNRECEATQGMGRFFLEVHPCHMDAVKPCRGHARDLRDVQEGRAYWGGDSTRNTYTLHGTDGKQWTAELNHIEIQEVKWAMAGSGREEQVQRFSTLVDMGIMPIPEYEHFTGERYAVYESPLFQRAWSRQWVSRVVHPANRRSGERPSATIHVQPVPVVLPEDRHPETRSTESELVPSGG